MHTIEKTTFKLNKGQYLTTITIQGKHIPMKLTSQSKPLLASSNPWFSFMPGQKMKIKENITQEIFFH